MPNFLARSIVILLMLLVSLALGWYFEVQQHDLIIVGIITLYWILSHQNHDRQPTGWHQSVNKKRPWLIAYRAGAAATSVGWLLSWPIRAYSFQITWTPDLIVLLIISGLCSWYNWRQYRKQIRNFLQFHSINYAREKSMGMILICTVSIMITMVVADLWLRTSPESIAQTASYVAKLRRAVINNK